MMCYALYASKIKNSKIILWDYWFMKHKVWNKMSARDATIGIQYFIHQNYIVDWIFSNIKKYELLNWNLLKNSNSE